MVDNLSGGRVGISLAAGWNPDDFSFFPERYAERHGKLVETLATVRSLWRGEELELVNGVGKPTRVRLRPAPLQRDLPVWLTAAGNPRTFEKAGELGANLLTHLLDQDLEDLAKKIAMYRAARAAHGHAPATGRVTVMVHTFIGEDLATTRERVRGPFCAYLKASRNLLAGLAQSRGRSIDVAALSERDLDELVAFLFERFSTTRALIGTIETCAPLVAALHAAGVDEIACLLDFGQSTADVLDGLPSLDALQRHCAHALPATVARSSAVSKSVEALVPADDLYEIAWRPLPARPAAAAPEKPAPAHWLILGDQGGIGERLADALGRSDCTLVSAEGLRLESDWAAAFRKFSAGHDAGLRVV
jgi:natural product biosynthesis luciferase-like monooxygenase protein